MKMYKYETHLHTYPVSHCATASVRQTLEFYASKGYDGVFVTNHFIDGNMNFEPLPLGASYKRTVNFYFSDYENALEVGKELGIKVFLGVELSYGGTDFLVFGLDKEWFLSHPEIEDMEKSRELSFMMENGGFVVQAHPFREASYIDHIRLFPRCISAVEVINASRTDRENYLADQFADNYGLYKTAGSDNHRAEGIPRLAGMMCKTPLESETDFIQRIKNGEMELFTEENN